MATMRAFIAIEIDPDIRRGLVQLVQELKLQMPGKAVRWASVENMHLTLKFLGDVPLQQVEALKSMLHTVSLAYPKQHARVGGLSAFPSLRRPRVIVVRIEGAPVMLAMQKQIEEEANILGYLPEERGFTPHLTLGRVSQHATPQELIKISQIISAAPVRELGVTTIQEICLFKSDLQPAGAVYTCLYRAVLVADALTNTK